MHEREVEERIKALEEKVFGKKPAPVEPPTPEPQPKE